MADLTAPHRELLERIALAELAGGVSVPFVSQAHDVLEKAGLIQITRGSWNTRVRCTAEGLAEARAGALAEHPKPEA